VLRCSTSNFRFITPLPHKVRSRDREHWNQFRIQNNLANYCQRSARSGESFWQRTNDYYCIRSRQRNAHV